MSSPHSRGEKVQVVYLGDLLHKVCEARHEPLRIQVVQDIQVQAVFAAYRECAPIIPAIVSATPPSSTPRIAHLSTSLLTTAKTSALG